MKALYGSTMMVDTSQMRGRAMFMLTLAMGLLRMTRQRSKLMARRESMMT